MRKALPITGYIIFLYITFYLSFFYFSNKAITLSSLKIFISCYPIMPDSFFSYIFKNFNAYMDTDRLMYTYILVKTVCTTLAIGVGTIYFRKKIRWR